MDDQDVKDILVDGDAAAPDVEKLIANATTKIRDEYERKAAEAKQRLDQLARLADERGQEADKARGELHGMTQYVGRAEQAAIANALAAAEAEARSMQADLAQAIETADGKRAAELQVKLGELTARKHTLEQGKDRIEEEIARAKDAPAPQPRQPAALAGDPYEAAIAGLPENQREWMRKHKDKKYWEPGKQPSDALMVAWHGARKAGFREDSAAFITYMDRILGHTAAPAAAAPAQPADASERFQEAPAAPTQAAQPAARKPVPAAPPSRAQGGGTNSGGKQFALTREQAHTAQRLGMSNAEYIQGIQEGIKRGKIQPGFLQAR